MKIRHIIYRGVMAAMLAVTTPAMAQPISDLDQPAAEQEPILVDPMKQARDAMARNDPAEALARYLRVLARDPGDLEALSGAGGAALAVGDADAAINFYVRAEKIAPRDGRIKAGLGSALVQKEQPRAALKLFDDATDLGVYPVDVALDRGLAYDLRGDNKRAQQDYLMLLRNRVNPEATRRLALSLAMSGDRLGALATLDPLLRKQDIPAWRARAFVLAMTGDAAGGEQAAFAVLPRYQAQALKPFLDRLGQLKPAEKAAAVHFGHFPEDKVPVMAIAPSPAPMPSSKGSPATVLPPTSPAIRETMALRDIKPEAVLAKPEKSTVELDSRSLAKDRRAADRKAAAEKAALERKAKAKEEAKAAKANPERYWVQVASGAYKPDLDKEWAKQKAKYGKQLAGKSPWTMPYKSTNRLMIGPFASKSAAQDYVNDVGKSGMSTFPVTTSSGQKVERLD